MVRVAANDEPNSVVYKITVWGSLVIYAATLPQVELSDQQIVLL
jgi:hypothetical protein